MYGMNKMRFSSGQRHSDNGAHNGSFASGGGQKRLAELKILVAEDEIFVSMAIEDALVAAGAEVVGPVMSLAAGIELLDSGIEIDGAILDVNLGDALVFPMAELLRDKGVPIIFHTAMGTRPEFAQDYPDATVCVKPTLANELVARAAALFG